MMMAKNKNNLSRNIPERVKKEIRQSDGFGCIFCGCPIIEYEHIEPTFVEAKEHDPAKMTLLCSYHHTNVTKGIISKSQVWNQKLLAQAKNKKIVYADDERQNISMLLIGTNEIHIKQRCVILSVYQKDIIWIDKNNDGKLVLNGTFNDSKGNHIVTIKSNEYIVSDQRLCSDMTFIGSIYTIRDQSGSVVFKIDFNSQKLKLIRINTSIFGRIIQICSNGDFIIDEAITIKATTFDNCGGVFSLA